MSPAATTSRPHGVLTWRPTKIMSINDLPNDDDFLSHLLIEKLGTSTVPLLVHKMDSSRRLPKTNSLDLMRIIRRYVTSKLPMEKAIKHSVDELLLLPSIRYFLKNYTQKQINAFATHASRYFELYHPTGSIEISHTSRYSHRTGKSELCILATRNIPAHSVVAELKGSMANLTDEEDKELKRTDLRNCDVRRDFSVIHSKSMKKNHLFLGPARFVNHDCNNNCELFREGRYITFRTLRPIAVGEELTAHYGDGYFGKKNKRCLCETCEKNGRGGYTPNRDNSSSDSSSSDDDSDSDSDASSSSSSLTSDVEQPVLNLNERRTRRGVYAIAKPTSESSGDSDGDNDSNKKPLADALDIPADGEMELTTAECDISSLSGPGSNPPTRLPSTAASLLERSSTLSGPTSSLSGLISFRSIISTRLQEARGSTSRSTSLTATKVASHSESVNSQRRLTRSVSLLQLSEKAKGKGKAKAPPAPGSSSASVKLAKGSGKDDSKGSTLENGPQTRPGLTPVEAAAPKKPLVLRDSDGKPLPTCANCSSVLPLITVDSKVVWGLETGKKDKNTKRECPRCIRHFAIYEVAWPRRVPPPGATSVTPQEESVPADINTKNVTKENLSVIDNHIAAAASSSTSSHENDKKSKKRQQETEPKAERDSKRRKSEIEPGVTRKPNIIKITYSSVHKRGMNVTSLTQKSSSAVKVEELAHDAEKLVLKVQPRANNGRFTRKGNSPDVQSTVYSRGNNGLRSSSRRKRANQDLEEPDEAPRKRPLGEDEQPAEVVPPIQKVFPRRPSGFRAGRLFSKPNPQQFALRAWSARIVDDSSEDEESHLLTPEDDLSPVAEVVDPDEGGGVIENDASRSPAFTRASLSCINPSPLAFAKSRWNSFRQATTVKGGLPRRKTEDESYNSEGEVSDISMRSSDNDIIMHTPSLDGEKFHTHFRQSYPILSPSAVLKPCIPKGIRFFSTFSETKPTLINAGWDDASDATEFI